MGRSREGKHTGKRGLLFFGMEVMMPYEAYDNADFLCLEDGLSIKT